MAADTDSEMKNLIAPLGAQAGVENYRKLVQTYLNLHLYQAALFWADKVVALTAGSPRDVYWLAQCMFLQKQYHRAAHLLRSRELEKSYVLCNSLTARCLLEANELKDALDVIKLMDLEVFLQNSTTSTFSTNIDNGMFDETPKFQVQSSVLLLKGKIYEAMDNRGLASDCYRQALQSDVHCYEAFECLIQHNMLTAAEEIELINALPISEQCTTEESEILLLLYRSKLKKYHTPADIVEPKNIICIPKQYNSTPHPETVTAEHMTTPLLEGKKLDRKRSSEKMSVDSLNVVTLQRLQASLDVVVSKAEQMYYNCDYQKCIGLTEAILKQDPYHSACLPIHISCLVELKQSNKLFTLAHNLVDLYPNLAISWFAVGCYYYIIGKSDYARRYLAKATTLDRLFGPAWLAYGHSFAIENEHDQAMAAYFKASQLMKGCHLPLMYIGLECGLTNNAPLAEKFFQQANKIAPDDPFVLHEMGVIAFQNLDYSFAEMHFKEALKIIKSRKNTIMPERWAPLYNNLGHALRKQKKFKPALLYHHEALVLMPQCASTYSAIAYVHALMNNLEDAVDWFHRALGLKRDDTFSTTMLNYVIEQLSEEQPPYPDAPDNIPAFVKQDDSTAHDVVQDEAEASVELSTINETGEMSMSLEMDITDANATPKD